MPARSINKRQQAYLQTLHLDSIGESRNVLQHSKLEEVEQALVDLAGLFKVMAENELSLKDAVDSGKLADSIQFDAVEFNAGVYSVDIKVLDYYDFVNKGVTGTEGGPSSPYQYKNNFVSKAFQ